VVGSVPDSPWVIEMSYAERTSHASLSRWTGSEWISADAQLRGKNVIAVSGWSGGRTLALVGDEYTNQLGFAQLGGVRAAQLPLLPKIRNSDYGCANGIEPMAMSALPSGEVFLAGSVCNVAGDDQVQYHGVAVERWGAAQARGKLTVLPRLSETESQSAQLTSIVTVSASDVTVAGLRVPPAPEGDVTAPANEAYVAHFDGKAWRTLSAPPIEGIDELQRSPDGRLWALSAGDLWVTTGPASDNANWERVPMPRMASDAGEHAVSSLWVRDSDDVWVTVGSEESSYVLRTKRGQAALSAPPADTVAELSSAVDPSAAYDCESPTLVLLTLSRQAPSDADFPSIRAALRGHGEFAEKAQLVEFPFLTRRYLGVRGDTDALQQIGQLLSQSKISGVDPELRCLKVAATRTLAIDFGGAKPDLPIKRSAADFDKGHRTTRTVGFGF